MKQKQKIQSIESFLDEQSKKDLYAIKYKTSIEQAKSSKTEENTINSLNLRTGYYSMRTRVKDFANKNNRPASKAIQWLFKDVFTNSQRYKYNKRILFQGGMFIFEYHNPKYKGTSSLPWFDKYPLVISLGPKITNLGVRNIGFNMHLLPPKIRIIVMCSIFELHKRLYRYQIFTKQNKPINIDYYKIIDNLKRYGVGFAVRMYIPQRMTQIVNFPYNDWHKGIFIPSRGYDSIRAAGLIKEWRQYNRANGFVINPNLDWKSQI